MCIAVAHDAHVSELLHSTRIWGSRIICISSYSLCGNESSSSFSSSTTVVVAVGSPINHPHMYIWVWVISRSAGKQTQETRKADRNVTTDKQFHRSSCIYRCVYDDIHHHLSVTTDKQLHAVSSIILNVYSSFIIRRWLVRMTLWIHDAAGSIGISSYNCRESCTYR